MAADGLSGDGCGLLLKQPERFLRTLAKEAGIALGSQFAAGLVFLPHEDDLREAIGRIARFLEGYRKRHGTA